MLKLKMTDDGLMVVDKGVNLCRFVSKETDNQVLNNARAELEKLSSDVIASFDNVSSILDSLFKTSIPDYLKTPSMLDSKTPSMLDSKIPSMLDSKITSMSDSLFKTSIPDYVTKSEHILKSEYDRLLKSITHYPVSHNRFYNPKKSKKQKQKEKIDRLEKELKEAREVIYSQAVTINRFGSKEFILIEHQQTTVNDSHKAKAKTGRKEGQKIINETKELLYLFWVKHGELGSGQFESLIKRKLSNNSVIEGLILVFEDGLPFTSKNEAIGVKAEFGKKHLVFSGLAKMISAEFRKR